MADRVTTSSRSRPRTHCSENTRSRDFPQTRAREPRSMRFAQVAEREVQPQAQASRCTAS